MVDNGLDRIFRDVLGMTDTEYMAWRGYKVKEDKVGIVEFKEECLKVGVVVHLRTQKQCNNFSTWLDSKGKRWYDDTRYIYKNEWSSYKSETHYCPYDGTYGDISWYKYNDYTILSYEEALLKPPITNNSKEAESIKLLPTKVLVIMLYNHVCSEEQYLEDFFEQVEKELKFRLDDYDSLCWAGLWLKIPYPFGLRRISVKRTISKKHCSN